MGWVQLDGELACWARERVRSPVLEHNGSTALREIRKVVAGMAMHHAGLAVHQVWVECWQAVAAVRMQSQQPMLASGKVPGREEKGFSGTRQPSGAEEAAGGAC